MHSQLVDNNGSGSIEYTEFAEVMNNDAADVQFSDNPADPVPWGLHERIAPSRRTVVEQKGPLNMNGMNLLPKGDILRRLAEKIELKHANPTAAFVHYDQNSDGELDRWVVSLIKSM